MDLAERSTLAQALRDDRASAQHAVAELAVRYPDQPPVFTTEDACLHLSFIAGAVQANSPALFADYAAWAGHVLASRSTTPTKLDELLALLAASLARRATGHPLVERTIVAGRAALARPPAPVVDVSDAGDTRTPLRLAYLAAALGGHRDAAWSITRDAVQQGLTVGDIYRDLVIWSQTRLGVLWAGAQITVAQEHMASAVTQAIVARLYPEIRSPRTAGRVLLAGVASERHVLPAQLAADLLELDGWDVAFVGPHLPVESVVSAIDQEHPDVIGLSTTMASSLPELVTLVAELRRRFPAIPIVAGGRAMRDVHDLGRELAVTIDPGDGTSLRRYARTTASPP